MSILNLRKSPWISNLEAVEPNFDEYIFCCECRDYVYEYCSIHGPLLVVPDDEVPSRIKFPSHVPRAALTVPHVFLHLAPSSIPGAGIGVFSTLSLPVGVRFGPYRGQITKDIGSEYSWRIYSKNNRILRMVDAGDDEQSNWMRYVNCSRHWSEQNLIAYQYKGQVYYSTIKIIPRFTELLVFYGSEFANVLNVDLRLYNSPQFYHGDECNELSEKEMKNSKSKSILSNTIHIQLDDNISKNDVHFDESNIVKILTETNKNPPQTFKNSEDIQKNTISKEFECNGCGGIFSTKNILSEHIHKCIKTIQTFEHDIQITQADMSKPLLQKYSCDICPFKTNQKRYIASHLKMHNTDKIFVCDICQYRCARRYRFDRHVRSHSVKKTLSCDTCQNKCADSSDVKHPLGTHRKEEPRSCVKCQYSSVNKSMSNAYAGIRSHSCNICPYRSIKKDSLKRHMRTHTGEKPYACDICSFRSAIKSDLTRHVRVYTGKKPYTCKMCLFSSARKSGLNKHMTVHTGKKPFACEICQYTCTKRSYLKVHMLKHTGEMPKL